MADRHTCKPFLLLMLKALGTLDRQAHHLSYQGGPKSPPHIFFVLTNLDYIDLGMSLKSNVLSQDSDVANIGHWPRAIYLVDRQTDRLTDRQTDKQVDRHIYLYILPCLSSHTSYHCMSMDCLRTVSELYMHISSVSLPLNIPYQALDSLMWI